MNQLPEFRIQNALRRPRLARYAATLGVELIVLAMTFLVRVIPPARRRQVDSGRRIGIFLGRFESRNWFEAHFGPILASQAFDEIVVIGAGEGLQDYDVEWRPPHAWMRKLLGDVGSKLIWTYVVARQLRPVVVGGFHFLCNGMTAIAVARRTAARSVYFSVGGWTELKGGGAYSGTRLFGDTGRPSKRREQQLVRIAAHADYVIAMGNTTRRRLQRNGLRNVEVCPGGISSSRFTEQQGPASDVDLVLVARLDPIKRIDRLVLVCRALKDAGTPLRAVVVGDGPEREKLVELARSEDVNDVLEFAGFEANVDSWLMRARLFVLTSDSEGLPLSMMEACCAGLPVVAANVGDISDLVEEGVNGYLVDPGDIDAYATRITSLLASSDRYERFSEAAKRKSKEFRHATAVATWQRLLC